MGFAAFVGCGEKNDTPDVSTERDIFYTNTDESMFASFSGSTVHLTTEAQWDALLDRFCDYAEAGDHVIFCNTKANNTQTAPHKSKSTPTTISTSNREELKEWMKEMEKAGKTVNVSYDNGSGTWNGTAYVNLSHQDEQAEPQTYSGTFRFVPTPAVQEPPLGGTVWALEVGDDTLIITVHGMMIWSSGTDAGALIIDGAEAVLEGIEGSYTDLHGETFLTIELYTGE
jgi:hypothetical protein